MATYKQIGYGSQGSEVTELQKLLNSNGYSLNADGIYGAKTQSAVKDYQQKNGLAVDGIVGNNTWGALTKAATPAAATPAAPTTSAGTANTKAPSTWAYDPFNASSATTAADKQRQELAAQKPGDFSYGDYVQSEAVAQAQALLQQQLANKPGAYQSQWQTQMNDTMNQILNRDKFSYDLNADALYQQYKDQYVLQGQQAMMDTMGQAQAMTGGYGNSYAQTVGQQTYQGYLQQLNDRVPELYQLALDQYNREGDALYNQYGLFADRENQDYGRYRDQVSDYNTERDYLANAYYNESDRDYNRYIDAYSRAYGEHRDSVSDWQQTLDRADAEYWNQYNRDYGQYSDDRGLSYENYWNQLNMAYQQDRDKVADQQWQSEFDEAKRQYDQQYALAAEKSSGGSSSDSGNPGRDSGNDYTKNPGLTKEQILSIQRQAGIKEDGIWGPQTAAQYDNGVRPEEAAPATLSSAGETFMKNLPYAPGGSDPETWRNVVDERLERAYSNGTLSDSDVMIIIEKLGLDK